LDELSEQFRDKRIARLCIQHRVVQVDLRQFSLKYFPTKAAQSLSIVSTSVIAFSSGIPALMSRLIFDVREA
jgi:hypothetical protein